MPAGSVEADDRVVAAEAADDQAVVGALGTGHADQRRQAETDDRGARTDDVDTCCRRSCR